jgi:hypothetical protein
LAAEVVEPTDGARVELEQVGAGRRHLVGEDRDRKIGRVPHEAGVLGLRAV